jgi:hypothetical protein
MKSEYTWDSQVGGFTCFKGDLKLALYLTHGDDGTVKNGVVVFKLLPPEMRTLYFTSPQIKVDDLKAILDSLPKPEDHPHSKVK